MKSFGEVAEPLRRSTVQVLGEGAGSGIIWSASGQIVTNAHVLTRSSAQIELWDGTRLSATAVKHDRGRDLAVLQVDGSGLPAPSIGDSTALRPGELVIAVGNPMGFTGAVSSGVVHGVGPLAGFGGRAWVQSNVRLAPGNSGGPLANSRGEIVGVNTMVAGFGGGQMALAVPACDVLQLLSGATGGGRALGVTVRPVPLPGEGGIGLLVLETEPDGAADRASLLIGDVLTGSNGRSFCSVHDLKNAIESASTGPLTIEFRRGGGPQKRRTTVQLDHKRAAAA